MFKIVKSIIGGVLGVGASLPIIYETRDAGIDYLNSHGFVARLFGVPGLIAVISAILCGGLLGGFKDYLNPKWSETVAGETNYNGTRAFAIISLLIHIAWIAMLE
jgi:hypothetical protein